MRPPIWFYKWSSYEYWPWWFFYFPLVPYWIWLAIRSRSLTFFTATNTNIEHGGFFGESKSDILNQISVAFRPWHLFIKKDFVIEQVLTELSERKYTFPIVVKPNKGERGIGVEVISNQLDLHKYHNHAIDDYILQEHVSLPIELGVLFVKLPGEQSGCVTSVTMKEFLSVTGDGHKTMEQLICDSKRARFQLNRLRKKFESKMDQILNANERFLLEPIGNHSLGTRFINANHLINEQLHQIFNAIVDQMPGFYYGRFDLKVRSISDLYQGNTIKIMELNGASSEPGHIYDTSVGLLNAYKQVAIHWKALSDIALENYKVGVKPVSLKELIGVSSQHFKQKAKALN